MLESLAALGLTRELGDLALGLRVGVVIDGHVDGLGARHDLAPGVVVAAALDWRVLAAPRDPLTLTLGLQLGVSHAGTLAPDGGEAAWTALDLRASATASRTLADVVTPYLSLRAFGGPIFWRDVIGSDTLHVQLAAGLGVELGAGLSLHVEGAVLAERGVFGGLGYTF